LGNRTLRSARPSRGKKRVKGGGVQQKNGESKERKRNTKKRSRSITGRGIKKARGVRRKGSKGIIGVPLNIRLINRRAKKESGEKDLGVWKTSDKNTTLGAGKKSLGRDR